MSACHILFCVGCPHPVNCRCRCPECKATPFASREELARAASLWHRLHDSRERFLFQGGSECATNIASLLRAEPALPFGHPPLHKD